MNIYMYVRGINLSNGEVFYSAVKNISLTFMTTVNITVGKN